MSRDGGTFRVIAKRSRSVREAGDVFVMSPGPDLFLYGRVIRANCPEGSAPIAGTHLVYVFDAVTPDKREPESAWLTTSRLLIPPLYLGNYGWRLGYFETVASQPLAAGDVFEHHCFVYPGFSFYLDEDGNRQSERTEPCGRWTLPSLFIFNANINDALGRPSAS